MSKLEVQGLVKYLDGKLTIDHVSFSVDDGEFFVLLGPSQGGKTTLLRLICGFEIPDAGQILLDGKDITLTDAQERNVAVAFQKHGLFPHMNVYDNIAYSLRFRHFSREEIEVRVFTAAEMLGLRALLKRPLVTLSGGEQQRVAIGRVMVKDAELYLFDEPISQLDPHIRGRIRQEIVMVHRIKRKPSIYITQNQHEAFTLASRIAIVAQGRIHQIGTPDHLSNAPANLFVAQFLSDPPLNFLEGTIQHADTRYRLHAHPLIFTFPTRWTHSLSHLGPQSRILLGIRPGIIVPEWAFHTLGTVPHALIRTQVLSVGPLMGKRTMRLKTEAGSELTAEFKDTASLSLEAGQLLTVAINPAKILFFNPQTEELLNPL